MSDDKTAVATDNKAKDSPSPANENAQKEHLSQQQLSGPEALDILRNAGGSSKSTNLNTVELVDGTTDGKVVERQSYTPTQGETADQVAKRAMGPGANEEQVKGFLERLMRENNLSDPTSAIARRNIVIPEHTFIPGPRHVDPRLAAALNSPGAELPRQLGDPRHSGDPRNGGETRQIDPGQNGEQGRHVERHHTGGNGSTDRQAYERQQRRDPNNGSGERTAGNGADRAQTAPERRDATTGRATETVPHTVRQGETLGEIVQENLPRNIGESRSDYGKRLWETVADVARKNGITNPDKIYPGQKIELPKRQESGEQRREPGAGEQRREQNQGNGEQRREQGRGGADGQKPFHQPQQKPTDQPQQKPPTDRPQQRPPEQQKPQPETQKPEEQKPEPQKPTPPPEKPIDREALSKKADELYNATEGLWFRTDEAKTKEILRGLNEKERKALDEIYAEKNKGKHIDQMLRQEMSDKDLTESLTLLNAKDKVTGVDKGKAERAAEAIDNAANGGFLGIGTSKKAIEEQLKGKSQEELKAIDEAYKARTGNTLNYELEDELSGSDLTKAKELAAGHNDDAARIKTTLEEHKEWGWSARSNNNCEKDLRDTISTMNSQQIAELDKTYQERYGKSLRETLTEDKNLPQETKDALNIYLKGSDKMTPADTQAVAEIALKSGNNEMFQEAFRNASPEARQQFLANGGEDKINEAFGTAYTNEYTGEATYSANAETQRAMDYVKQGKLDTSTKISDNTGTFNDNEDAIEQSLVQMTPAERESYKRGKQLADTDPSILTNAEKEKVDYYNKVHTALDKAGNDREIAKWEDMIVNGKDGSLITKLAAHGGMIDDGMGEVLGTIEDMSKSDWEKLKTDPEYRKEVEKTLAIDLSDSEMARAREALDKKMSVDTYEASKTKQRDVTEAVKDETGFWNDNEDGVIKSLEKMTPEEQRRYREDPEYKKLLDETVTDAMDAGPERDAAMGILNRVARGEKPESDIISNLEMHSTHFNVDEAKVVQDIEKAFRDDPTLRERLKNPQTPEDKKMATQFDKALRRALDPAEYETYGKSLLENGRLPMEVKAELYRGVFNDDEKAFYDSLKKGNASEQDWKEILADPEKTMGFLSEEEREVALNIARQKGEMRPEDVLRGAILGAGTDEDPMKEALKDLNPEQKQAVKDAYEVKYGSNLTGDAMGELGGRDQTEVARQLRGPQTAREAYNEARTEVYDSVDGFGKAFVSAMWDGTGEMTQDQLEQYSRAMSDHAKNYNEMPLEERKQFEENLYKSLELYQKSEEAAADMLVDGAIIAAGVGGAAFTGGVSLSLLGATAVGGALFKVGAKSAIMGADYDFGSAQVVSDSATGAIDAATIFLGPAQAAQMLRMGEKSAMTAGRAALGQVDDVAKATGKQLLKEGSEDILQKSLKEQVAFAISNGAEAVDDKAIAKIAEKVATSTDDIPQVSQLIKTSLNEAVQAEAANGMKATMRELALNTGAGAGGGMLSGGVRGGVDGESLDSVIQQAGMGAFSGGAMAGAFTLAFKGLGKSVSAFRHADDGAHLKGDIPNVTPEGGLVRVGGEVTAEPPKLKLDKNGRITEITNSDGGSFGIKYHKTAELEGQLKEVAFPSGVKYKSDDGINWTVYDKTHPNGKYDVKGKMEVHHDGNVSWQADGGPKSVLSPDGSRTTTDHLDGSITKVSRSGAVQEVSTAHGGVKYDYNADGSFNKATFKNGDVIESARDGKAVLKKLNGTEEQLDGRITITNEGKLKLQTTDDSPQFLYSADGGRVQVEAKTGRITEATTATGDRYQYGYDENGKLNRFVLPDGRTYTPATTEGSGWTGGWDIVSPKADHSGSRWTADKFSVDRDGALVSHHHDRHVVHSLDGTNRVYETDTNRLLLEISPDGRQELPNFNKIDGRSREYSKRAYEEFRGLRGDVRARVVDDVVGDLKLVRVTAADGNPTTAYEALMSNPYLSDAQKSNILENLGEVRQHLLNQADGSLMRPDAKNNWLRTQEKVSNILDLGPKMGMRPQEMEDAVLASIYSGGVNLDFDRGLTNNLTHHLDGANAANEALTRQGIPPDRVERIVQAIKESQSSRPEMGSAYLSGIKPELEMRRIDGKITPERYDELRHVLDDMTVVGEDGVARLKPIADPKWPVVKNADGSFEAKLTPDQRELLEMTGIKNWNVSMNPHGDPAFKQLPKAEQDKLLGRYMISRAVIESNVVDDVATTSSLARTIDMRGPGSDIRDGNIWDSVAALEQNYQKARDDLTPQGQQLGDAARAQRSASLLEVRDGSIQAEMKVWAKSKGLEPHEITYLRHDGQLKYPEPRTAEEATRLRELTERINGGKVKAQDLQQVTDEVRALKYKGLNAEEIRQYELAEEAKTKMADLLRASERSDGTPPGDFVATEVPQTKRPEWLLSKPAEMPEKTGEVWTLADGSSVAKTKNGAIMTMPDGTVQVSDTVAGTARTYDPQGRIVEAMDGKAKRSFTYDSEGKLDSITLESGDVIKRGESSDWNGPIRSEDGTVEEGLFYRGSIVADGDGSLRYVSAIEEKGNRISVDQLDGTRYTIVNNGRIEYQKVPFDKQVARLDNLAKESFPDTGRYERFTKLLDDFEASAAIRGMDENERAKFYLQINRLLEPNSAALFSQAERADLAEQIVGHALNPSTVDQGFNNTCNVTTLEVRNYSREPHRNAQLIADIATTGKFRTDTSGIEIDMSKLEYGLKPDTEAVTALELQRDLGKGALKVDGRRDWSSQITEMAMVNAHWQGQSHMIVNGRLIDRADLAFDASHNLIGKINNQKNFTQLYDENGKVVTRLADNQKYFNKDKVPIQIDKDKLIYDTSGSLKGFTDDSNITKIFDANGKPIKTFSNARRGYDSSGKEIFTVLQPKEVIYDKTTPLTFTTTESVRYKRGDQWFQLTDEEGKLIDSPNLNIGQLESLNRTATGSDGTGYSLRYDPKAATYANFRDVSTANELGDAFAEMKKDGKLPAVLMVHTANRPFSKISGLEKAMGATGDWHVVNVHDYDLVTRMVKFTNQWGSKHDYMEEGIPIDRLFDSMKEPALHKFWKTDRGKAVRKGIKYGVIGAGVTGAGAAVYGGYELMNDK